MNVNRVASIDIGTNTVLMLIADRDKSNKPKKIKEYFSVARLGENVGNSGLISDEAKDRAKVILHEYKAICDEFKVEKILVAGTSALRDAKNSDDVCKEFNEILGTDLKIIKGELEAALSFVGSVTSNKSSMVIDIGGGSTEIITGKSKVIQNVISLQQGAVRLSENLFKRMHPPPHSVIEASKSLIINDIVKCDFSAEFEKVYAVAGTATTLATTAMGLADNQVETVNGFILKKQDLLRIFDLYQSLSIHDIINKLRVHPKRADLILAGALIMNTIVEHFGISEIIISSHGLRYGIIIDYFNNPSNW